jgi:hypothetical protein
LATKKHKTALAVCAEMGLEPSALAASNATSIANKPRSRGGDKKKDVSGGGQVRQKLYYWVRFFSHSKSTIL